VGYTRQAAGPGRASAPSTGVAGSTSVPSAAWARAGPGWRAQALAVHVARGRCASHPSHLSQPPQAAWPPGSACRGHASSGRTGVRLAQGAQALAWLRAHRSWLGSRAPQPIVNQSMAWVGRGGARAGLRARHGGPARAAAGPRGSRVQVRTRGRIKQAGWHGYSRPVRDAQLVRFSHRRLRGRSSTRAGAASDAGPRAGPRVGCSHRERGRGLDAAMASGAAGWMQPSRAGPRGPRVQERRSAAAAQP
jgi:hypothetical protein